MPEFDGPVDDVVDPDDAVNTLSYRRIMGWGLISLVPMIVVWGNVYPHALTVSPNRLYHADEVMGVNYGNGNEYGNAVKIAIPDNDVARRIYYRPKKR